MPICSLDFTHTHTQWTPIHGVLAFEKENEKKKQEITLNISFGIRNDANASVIRLDQNYMLRR